MVVIYQNWLIIKNKKNEEKGTLNTNKGSIKKIIDFGGRFIDYKIGILGAGFMGLLVFVINYNATSELSSSLIAASKQSGYTFFFGGSVMKGCEYLSITIRKRTIALLAAVIIPSIITLSLTFGLHKLKGTPLPVESTLPTLLIIPATAVWGYKKRNKKIQKK